jgi:hypothetical protein
MKFTRISIILALALAGGFGAQAQTNNIVPKDTDYAAFSRFITERNIFDPSRQPHNTSTRPRARTTRTRTSNSAPSFTLVGTMSYEKGMFAFFNGNNSDLKKALPVSGKIAGYTVTEISRTTVKLESADKKEKLELKIGNGMRQENGKWLPTDKSDVIGGTTTTTETSSASDDSSTPASPSATPSSNLEPNDVLKRLMQLREKENQ